MQQLSLHWGPTTRIRVGRGSLAAESELLAELDGLLGEGLDRLAEPVLLVVPSTTLRRHLLGRLLAHRDRGAVLGLDCRTHLGLAASLLESAGQDAAIRPGDSDLFSLFARRLARRERALEASLEHLMDGYGAVLGAVRDLLDAGFDPALVDGLDEALATDGPHAASPQELARARALIRVAAGTLEEMERWRLGRSSNLLQEATRLVRRRPLAARRIVIYGFNDATGLTTDFLLALLDTYGGTLYLDHPPDPAERRRPDPGLAFSRTFRERIETSVGAVEQLETEAPPPRVESFRALGAEAEVREVARRIGRLIAAGAAPEGIGVVVRRLDEYVSPVRTQFARLGVPFSAAERCGPFDPRAARLHAVLQILREGPGVPLERWLGAATLAPDWTRRADLLVALHTLGAGRLGEAAKLDLAEVERRGGLPLPARRGFAESETDANDFRAARRWVDATTLSRAVAGAAAVEKSLSEWPGRTTARRHAEKLSRLLREDLGWPIEESPWRDAFREVRRVMDAFPNDLELDFEELQVVLGRELAAFGRTELGGAGGGVQVLDVTAARSLTFDHLFLLGLNRGVFPRQVREDPILTDPLRQVLGRSGFGVLPDLPVKRNGFHEERYLFAQLLAASRRITISWQDVDDQQKNLRAVSPLVERLHLAAQAAGEEVVTPTARAVFSSTETAAEDPRPPYESAVLAGLSGDRDAYPAVLAVALADHGGPPAKDLAAARLAVLDEVDPVLSRAPEALGRLGPWLGSVGAIRSSGDPRPLGGLFVTALEGLARCPWQHFLRRVLRLERLPDPLETVPGVNPLLVGLVVHETLEAIVDGATAGRDLEWNEALASTGVTVDWPEEGHLEKILLNTARRLVQARDLGLPGLDHALALAARPHLDTARQEDWPSGASRWPVIATEIEGHFDFPATAPGGREEVEARRIRFRADRMDRTEEGFSFTDYKTGRWAPPGTPSATAGERLLAGVRGGEWLQAAAYAMSASGHPSRGRYLYLNPSYDDDAGREFAVGSTQATLVDNFTRAIGSILAGWDQGTLFPRLLDFKASEPRICSFCEVADACVRGDSGARRRLSERIETWSSEPDPSQRTAAMLAVWELARPAGGGRRKRK